MKTKIQPVEKSNLAGRVYTQIRDSLIAGRFMPSERIRISETAQLFGTSDTPVREALLRLVSEHALEMETAKQIAVPALSLSRYVEIRTVRIALEALAVELAVPNITERVLQDLVRINKRFAHAEGGRDAELQLRYNREFHFGIYAHCRLPTLLAMIESMWTAMGPILRAFYERSNKGYDQGQNHHSALIDALRGHDVPAAVAAIRSDLLSAGPSIELFLREYEESQASEAPT